MSPLLALLLLFGCSPGAPERVPGRTWYVDSAHGDDAASGTSPEAPFATLAPLAGLRTGPGDAILLRRGSRLRGSLRLAGGGTEEHPVRLGAYGSGDPPVIDFGGAAGLHLSGVTHVIVADLRLTNARRGIFVDECAEITIRNVEVDHCVGGGLIFRGEGSGFLVEDCHVHHVDGDGLATFGIAGIVVRRCRFHHILDTALSGGHDAIALHEARGQESLIENNVCRGLFSKACVSLTIGTRAVVRRNFLSGGRRYGILCGNGSTALIHDNVIVVPAETSVPGAGIATGMESRVRAFNNTICNGGAGEGERCSFGTAPTGSLEARNNISVLLSPGSVHHWVGEGDSRGRVVADHNLYHPDDVPPGREGRFILGRLSGRLEAWRLVGNDRHGLAGDPLFAGELPPRDPLDCLLRAGSPACGSGTDLSGIFQADFRGIPRKRWDMGAFACETRR